MADDDKKMVDGVPADLAKLYDKIDTEVTGHEHPDTDDDNKKVADDKTADDDKTTDDDDNTDDDNTDDDNTDDTTGDVDDDVDGDVDDDAGATGFEVLGLEPDAIAKLQESNPDFMDAVKTLIDHKADVADDTSSEDDTDYVDDDKSDKKIGDISGIGSTLTEEQYNTLKEKNPEMAEIIKALDGTVGKLSTALSTVSEDEEKRLVETQQREDKRNFRTINKVLDGLTEDFPIFGESKKLPRDAEGKLDDRNRSVKARSEVWNKATKLLSSGLYESFDEAVDAAVTLYRGDKGKNLAMRTVAKELAGRQKQLTSRPTKQKTKKKQPKQGSDEYMEKVVGDAMKEAGVDG